MIRSCVEPRCPDPATYRGRCARHSRSRERRINRAGRKVYNTKRWKILRRRKLFLTPLCEHPACVDIATDVHHLVAIEAGGEPYSMDNLQALCHSHHSVETRREQAEA